MSPFFSIWSAGQVGSQFVSNLPQRKVGYFLLLCAITLSLGLPASAASRALAHARMHHAQHAVLRTAIPAHHRRHYQVGLGRWTPMFPGSHDMLVRENEELDRLQLPRIADDYELTRYELSQELVPVQETDALKIASDLPDNRRYCRPWTREFLQDFTDAFYNEFHMPLQINSLVRTVEQQHRLRRWNHFAAPEFGDTASTHLTGVTFDMSRRGLTFDQYEWIRNYLLPLQAQGMVDPIEERQPVLHIVVYEKYSSRNDMKSAWSEANEPTEMNPLGSAGAGTLP
ncbi:MAG TPA: DUF5715 family protein [Terriglobales bacterium]|nr:DUF5715 family protein [Terriglobales bacterium]